LTNGDEELRQTVQLLYEIAYKLMFRLYDRHRDMTPPPHGEAAKQPEIDLNLYTPM